MDPAFAPIYPGDRNEVLIWIKEWRGNPMGSPEVRLAPSAAVNSKPELVQHRHQTPGILRTAAQPDVEIARMPRPAMECHGITADHEVINPVSA